MEGVNVEQMQQRIDAVVDAERHVATKRRALDELHGQLAQLKQKIKGAEAGFNDAVEELREAARGEIQGKLFEALGGDEPANDGYEKPGGWRHVPLENIEPMPTQALRWLNDVKIHTVGDVADWTKTKPLTDIIGIGPVMAEKIEAALETFWEDRDAEADTDTDAKIETELPSWHATPVGDLVSEVPAHVLRHLEDGGVSTLGELWQQLENDTIGNVKNVGPAAVEKARDGLSRYLQGIDAIPADATDDEPLVGIDDDDDDDDDDDVDDLDGDANEYDDRPEA